eukprot:TCONS_00050627-protein
MASLRSKLSGSTIRTCGNVIRRSLSTQSSQKSFVVPAIASSIAVITAGGTAAYAYNQMKNNNCGILPVLEASAPTTKAAVRERTFIMIKPDGVKRGLVADIIKRFEQRGYKLVAMKMMMADMPLLSEHYGDLKSKPFFPGLVKFISSGPVVAMVWEGKSVVKQGRQMLGETNPLASKPGSIRGDFSIDLGRNVIHGSDSVESANTEISLWFKESELMNYTLPLESMVFE